MTGIGPTRRVTNRKLTDLRPTWARFPGWSVLFDDPAGRQDLVASPTQARDGEVVALYRRLDRLAVQIAELLEPQIAFARLPADTFHVTVLDGISPSSLPAVADEGARDRWERVLSAVPTVRPADRTAVVRLVDPLVQACRQAIRFEPGRLVVRGHAVLVELEAADRGSRRALRTIAAARAEVLEQLSRDVGADLVTAWRPHITLGYLADRAASAPAAAAVTDLAPPRGTITFASASIYWFESMVSFHRSL